MKAGGGGGGLVPPPHPRVTGHKGRAERQQGVTPSDAARTSGEIPANGAGVVRVLYLFAGARRKSGLARSLRVACNGLHLKCYVDEVDVLRGGRSHDLLNKKRQEKILIRIRRGHYHLTAASPPCGSFTRARSANKAGPRPIRSKKFPRGFPWLQGASRLQARIANELVDFTAQALSEQMKTSPGLSVLEHPEDLGKAGADIPGSIWQFEAIKDLGN